MEYNTAIEIWIIYLKTNRNQPVEIDFTNLSLDFQHSVALEEKNY